MKVTLEKTDLRPIVEQVVNETLRQFGADRAKLNERLGYSEPEAAAAIGVARHVLRDCRLRGEIQARKVGKRWIYSSAALIAFLSGGEK